MGRACLCVTALVLVSRWVDAAVASVLLLPVGCGLAMDEADLLGPDDDTLSSRPVPVDLPFIIFCCILRNIMAGGCWFVHSDWGLLVLVYIQGHATCLVVTGW